MFVCICIYLYTHTPVCVCVCIHRTDKLFCCFVEANCHVKTSCSCNINKADLRSAAKNVINIIKKSKL